MTGNNRIINFGAGPAALPQEVLAQAAAAVLNYNNTGMSILEIPHRDRLFDDILNESKALIRELAALDDDYEILWLQGGGRLQFAMIPMNFLREGASAGYLDSGHWAHDAMTHAAYYGTGVALGSTRAEKYTSLPQWPATVASDLDYVHLTTNNTIYGTQWQQIPSCPVPLIADMSSDIFSMSRDYNRFDLFYAVAQKNIGAAGVTMVALRKQLLSRIQRKLPPALDYAQQVKHGSVLNTPPVFAIYVSLLTLRWIKAKGIAAIESSNREKAAMLYAELDSNPLFTPIVKTEDRSLMNVVFRGTDPEMESSFLARCLEHNITGIAGHRSVGGFRVSLYNAITKNDVAVLIRLMQETAQTK